MTTGTTTKRRGHGEGSLYKRESDGKWVGTLDLGYIGGKRKRKVVYATTQKEAAAKMKAERAKLDSGVDITAHRENLDAFLTRWLVDVVAPTLAPKTVDQYRRLTRLHIVPVLGSTWIDRLTTAQVSAWLKAKRATGLSPKTCNHLRGTLRAALNHAIREGLIARNPVTATKPVSGESKPIQPLTVTDLTRLKATVAGTPNETLYRIMLGLGLRIGEALALKWENVDLDGTQPWAIGRPCLRIEWTLQRVAVGNEPSTLILKRPKTPKSRRVLPLPAPLVAMLRSHRKSQAARQLAASVWKDTGLIFTTPLGTPIDPRNALRLFKEACVAADVGCVEMEKGDETITVSTVRLHDLRHSAATALLAEGVPMKVVSELLGHSQMSTTADVYGHVLSETLADATDRLAAAWGS